MNITDLITYAIVALAVFYVLRSVILRKGKKGCCAKGCSMPKKDASPAPENDKHSCNKENS